MYRAPLHRPDRAGLHDRVREIGAVVLVDDLEFGGAALEELLAAAPECAFLLAATPEVAAPPAESHLEEVFLTGLGRSASLELLEQAVDRPLSDDEANWAGDLWFESEGLPLRFVQAGSLLRQRDGLRGEGVPRDEFGLPVDEPSDVSVFSAEGREVPLPSLGEGAAPAAPLAARLGQASRETLRFAVALGGEVPHQAHLPALVGDTHADAALGELLGCGLLSPVGTRYRLAAGVLTQLEAAGYGEGAGERAHTAAQHYAWWTGHPSVTPERAAAEADAVLAALGALVPGGDPAHPATAVKLARSAAPAFAAGLHWGRGSVPCGSARPPPASPARWRKRPTSTTNWASWHSAPETWTAPVPNWRRPSASRARSPTSGARSRGAARWPWSRTARAARWSPAAAPRPATRSPPRATRSPSRPRPASPPRTPPPPC